MKTILVHYAGCSKKYPFRINDDSITIGDILKSRQYDNRMIVDTVLPEVYSYCNTQTGELTNKCTSVYCVPVKLIVLRQDDDDVVYAQKVEKS